MPYLGYGTTHRFTVCGRVLKDERWRPAADTDSRWRNLVRFWKHLESDEVPGARLRGRFGNVAAEAVSDGEGYFRLDMDVPSVQAGKWHAVAIDLLQPRGVGAVANVLVPSAQARFGVISDIDDTIVASHVTRKVRMVLTAALNNARTRKPFAGVSAFYRALHAGGLNPFFYVSKSPWNLYPPLLEYLRVQGLPLGPILLRDFGLRSNRRHKTETIAGILSAYPGLRFVLVGDSGEQDPEIYGEIAGRFPGRILATYIRAVKPVVLSDELVLATDAETAAAHAAAAGLIQASDLRAVRAEKVSESSSSKRTPSSGALK
jgi:phosphatidate phosphatase APP1